MRKDSTLYTFLFAFAVCVTCSLTLAVVSEGLKARKAMNVALDEKKNILKAMDLMEPVPAKATGEEVLAVYARKIEEKVIDANGALVNGKRPADIAEGEAFYPLYVYKEDGRVMAYGFPIVGKGLWSTIYGYLAIEQDAVTVRGITFYKHGETPGLGAEIEKDWFQNNFKGKKTWSAEEKALMPVAVVKGKAADVVGVEELAHNVDGISGATMTSQGITAMIGYWLNVYEPFFKGIRRTK